MSDDARTGEPRIPQDVARRWRQERELQRAEIIRLRAELAHRDTVGDELADATRALLRACTRVTGAHAYPDADRGDAPTDGQRAAQHWQDSGGASGPEASPTRDEMLDAIFSRTAPAAAPTDGREPLRDGQARVRLGERGIEIVPGAAAPTDGQHRGLEVDGDMLRDAIAEAVPDEWTVTAARDLAERALDSAVRAGITVLHGPELTPRAAAPAAAPTDGQAPADMPDEFGPYLRAAMQRPEFRRALDDVQVRDELRGAAWEAFQHPTGFDDGSPENIQEAVEVAADAVIDLLVERTAAAPADDTGAPDKRTRYELLVPPPPPPHVTTIRPAKWGDGPWTRDGDEWVRGPYRYTWADLMHNYRDRGMEPG